LYTVNVTKYYVTFATKGILTPNPSRSYVSTSLYGCDSFGDVKFFVGVTESSIVFASVNTKPMTRQQWRGNVFWQGVWGGQEI